MGCKHNNVPEPPGLSVEQTIAADTSMSLLQTAITKAGMKDLLNAAPSITLFAPDNTAFAKGGITKDSIAAWPDSICRKLVQYHLLAAALSTGKMQQGQNIKTQLGTVLFVSNNPNGAFINSIAIKKPNIACSNGLIQVMDKVLVAPTQTLMQLLQADAGNFSLLLQAVTKDSTMKANFADLSAVSTIYTMFAPTDNALQQSKDSISSSAIIGKVRDSLLTAIVYRYMTTGYYVTGDFVNGSRIINRHQDTLLLGKDPLSITPLLIDTPRSTQPPKPILLKRYDKLATNGVLHVIDSPVN